MVERADYEEMERGFWKALLQNAPSDELQVKNANLNLVQLAVTTATILRILGVYVVEGKVTTDLHIPSLHALPKLLTYRIPNLRGAAEKPFQEPPAKQDYRLKFTVASV